LWLTTNSTGVSCVRYTPSQVRHAVGITQETLRHWRSALASLAGLKGHSPVFRPGQLLGIAVVRVLVEEFGVGVSTLKTVDRDIFAICSTPQWVRLAGGYLLIRPSQGTAKFLDRLDDAAFSSPAIVLPLESVVASLREALLEVAPEEAQRSFVFPPLDVSGHRIANGERV
jgi:hypothetical protein